MTEQPTLPESTVDGRARAEALAAFDRGGVTPTAAVGFVSRGRCLVIGEEARALAAAARLGASLTCVVAVPSDQAPSATIMHGVRVVLGGRPRIRGALGDFKAWFAATGEGHELGALLIPPVERFDLVLDLQSPPSLQQALPPLGYYAPGPDDHALEQVLTILPDMQGEFEKPKYTDYDPEICAHGRSGKRGCTRCIDACPTGCILPDRTLDARRCISYLTIEHKGVIDPALRSLMGNWVFGCDVCQLVCPWNIRFATPEGQPALAPRAGLPFPELTGELALSREQFNHKFKASPVQRARRRGYLRNACIVLGNLGDPRAIPALVDALEGHEEGLVRGAAAWALGRFGGRPARMALESALRLEPDEGVRQEIIQAIAS
jgi:ferredoxin